MIIREPSIEEREAIENYLYLDEEQLYSLLPQYDAAYNNTYFSPDGQQATGKKIFDNLKQRLKQKICNEWSMCKKINDPVFEDSLKLAIVIGDAIATSLIMLPPVLIASIILKIGLRKFCSCSDKNK